MFFVFLLRRYVLLARVFCFEISLDTMCAVHERVQHVACAVQTSATLLCLRFDDRETKEMLDDVASEV